MFAYKLAADMSQKSMIFWKKWQIGLRAVGCGLRSVGCGLWAVEADVALIGSVNIHTYIHTRGPGLR